MRLRALGLVATTLLLLGAPASAQPTQVARNVTGNVSVKVKEDRPGLLARATIRPEAALRIALARVPGGRVREAEIEVERRRLVYSFELAVPGTKGVHEVIVDAASGAVLVVEDEDDEDTDDDTDDDTDERRARAKGAAKAPAAPVRRGRS
jgi:hypothetical protein